MVVALGPESPSGAKRPMKPGQLSGFFTDWKRIDTLGTAAARKNTPPEGRRTGGIGPPEIP
jgi:hypothetical protein